MRRSGATLRFLRRTYPALNTWVPSVGVTMRRAEVTFGGATQRREKKEEEEEKKKKKT